ISASGLTAERLRMDTIASNVANANTTRTEAGGPYRRKLPVFATREEPHGLAGSGRSASPFGRAFEAALGGVRVVGIVEDNDPFRLEYQPGHPDADAEGYVAYPNVNIVTEMVDMITAGRAYEANVVAMQVARGMAMKALEIGRG